MNDQFDSQNLLCRAGLAGDGIGTLQGKFNIKTVVDNPRPIIADSFVIDTVMAVTSAKQGLPLLSPPEDAEMNGTDGLGGWAEQSSSQTQVNVARF